MKLETACPMAHNRYIVTKPHYRRTVRSRVMLCEVEHLSKSFVAPDGKQTISVLVDVSFSLESGQSMAITGPSGSGKTTLLNCIATLARPDSGSIIIDGENVTQLPENGLCLLRNKKIGVVFQQHYLLPHCTLLENILIPTLPWPGEKSRRELREQAVHLAERIGLKERLHHRPGSMSVGECQRGAVIRALINSPLLLCADEPTGSLDRTSADSLGDLLVELNREERIALLVVTHSQRLAERMDRCYRLNDGMLLE